MASMVRIKLFLKILMDCAFIPESWEELPDKCFAQQVSLYRVTFANGSRVQRFGNEVFKECASLREIEIPASVQEIHDQCFCKCSELSRVVFARESTLRFIGKEVFQSCPLLRRIEIPASVEVIDDMAFGHWFVRSHLSEVTFAEGSRLKRIGKDGFSHCQDLREIEIPASVEELGDACFAGCSSLGHVKFASGSCLKRIGRQAFEKCIALEEIELPASLEHIGASPFLQCNMLKITFSGPNRFFEINGPLLVQSHDKHIVAVFGHPREVVIPATVEEIGKHCFFEPKSERGRDYYDYDDEYDEYGYNERTDDVSLSLCRITFESGSILKRMKDAAFENCRTLQEIEIPATVEEICNNCFCSCPSLCRVTFAKGSVLKRIGVDAFLQCKSFQEIEIPATVSEIGQRCFSDCESLSHVTFASGSVLTLVGRRVFFGCKSLNKVELPASIQRMGGAIFSHHLQVSFSDQSEMFTIMDNFLICNSGLKIITWLHHLASVTIPATVEEIGNDCFSFRHNLSKVRFAPGSIVKRIGKSAFYSCESLEMIRIPASVEVLGDSCFNMCYSLYRVKFAKGSALKRIEEWAFSNCESLEKITIPAGVTEIGGDCFYGCFSLRVAKFAEGSKLRKFSRGMFVGCESLIGIKVPASVEEIGISCFGPIISDSWEMACCYDLSTVIFASDSKLMRIEDKAFESCPSLQQIEIPATVESIGNRCFGKYTWEGETQSCSALSRVTFASGSKLKSIGNEAFCWCKKLNSINIPDTVERFGIDCFSKAFLARCANSPDEGKKALARLVAERSVDIPDTEEEEEERDEQDYLFGFA